MSEIYFCIETNGICIDTKLFYRYILTPSKKSLKYATDDTKFR